jgi:DNA-binding winged helix-turn-helix (wHTH) protein
MPGLEQQQPTFQFGVFELNPRTGELRKHGVKLKLQEQPAQILALLLEHAGEVVTREDIQKRLWPEGTYVDFDNAINSAVRKLRDALGDSPESPRFVETLARRGYRFIAPVSHPASHSPLRESSSRFLNQTVPLPRSAPKPELVLKPERTQRRNRHFALGLVALAVGLAATTLLWTTRKTHRTVEAEFQSTPLTSYPGTESGPSFSPDGTRVAFSWDGPNQDNLDIYVKLVGAGDPVRLTKDPVDDHDPAWSPDGNWIAFLRDLNDTERVILLIPALGGSERTIAHLSGERLLGGVASNRNWMADEASE